jgi:hypothetical protein
MLRLKVLIRIQLESKYGERAGSSTSSIIIATFQNTTIRSISAASPITELGYRHRYRCVASEQKLHDLDRYTIIAYSRSFPSPTSNLVCSYYNHCYEYIPSRCSENMHNCPNQDPLISGTTKTRLDRFCHTLDQ